MALSKYQQASSGFIPITQAGARSDRDTPSIEPDTAIRPVAQPVDTFVRVGPTPQSPLREIANSLRQFEAALSPILDRKQREEDDAEQLRAQREFLTNNETGFAEGVRSGRIPANASPVFVKAYKEMEGRALARNAEGSIYERYETDAIRANEDPAAFSPWVSSQVASSLNGVTDPDILRGAVPGISTAVTRLGLTHAKEVGQRVMQKALNGVGSDIIGAIQDASEVPAVDEKTGELVRWGGVTDKIIASVQNGRSIGLPEDKLLKVATDSLIAKALQERDVDLLGMLPKDIAETPYAAKAIQVAHDQILIKSYNDERRADASHKREAKATHGDATRSVIQALTGDVNAELPEELLAKGERADPEFRVKVEDLRNKMRVNTTKVDPQREIDASVRINTANDPVEQAVKEITAGNIADPTRVNSVLYTAQRLQQSRDKGEASILRSPATRQFEKALREKFGKPDVVTGRTLYDEEGYGRALVEYHSALVEWEEKNTAGTSIDRLKASRDIGETLLKNYGETKDVTKPTSAPQSAPAKPNGPSNPVQGITVTPPLADDPVERARQSNPALRNVPEDVIKRFLPEAEREAEPGRRSALEAEGLSLAAADAPDSLGVVSARYESGGRGVGFVSTGFKDPGGPSYGVHQLSSKDSMPGFLRSEEGQPYAASFEGLAPGSREFNAVYKQLAADDPQGLAEAQKAYYSRTHYAPVYDHASRLGFDTEDRGVQEALFSISVQHGGAKRVVSIAARDGASSPREQIKALYAARTQYVAGLKRLPEQTRASVLGRYKREVKDALRLASAT